MPSARQNLYADEDVLLLHRIRKRRHGARNIYQWSATFRLGLEYLYELTKSVTVHLATGTGWISPSNTIW